MTSKQALKKICDNVNMYCIDFEDETELKSLVEIIKKDLKVLDIFRELIDYRKPTYFLECHRKSVEGKIITEWLGENNMTAEEALEKLNFECIHSNGVDDEYAKELTIVEKALKRLEMYECYFKPDDTYIRKDGEISFEFSGTDFVLYADKNDTYYEQLLELAKDIDKRYKDE